MALIIDKKCCDPLNLFSEGLPNKLKTKKVFKSGQSNFSKMLPDVISLRYI
jgi:hypothetical protein